MDSRDDSPARAMQIQYDVDGHLFTTFVVAVLAGIPVAQAAELSWGSQLPDEERRFTATSNAWNSLWNEHSRRLLQTLHSLHGGDAQAVVQRREDLRALVSSAFSRGEPDWRVGLMIHAFGDSYAHTHLDHGQEVAYGIPWGHGGDGHVPDQIRNFPQKYLAYVTSLYQALGGRGDARAHMARLFAIIEGGDTISARIVAYATELGLDEQLSEPVRTRLLAQVSATDVTATMAEMEKRFSSTAAPGGDQHD